MNSADTRGSPKLEQLTTPKVLHVDDDGTFLELTRGMLQRTGLLVTSESDPTAVPARLAETPVDAVVSDYEMPAMDGGALFERVRGEHPDLPFVLFTGEERKALEFDPGARERARYVQKRGARGFDSLTRAVWDLVEADPEGAVEPFQ